MSGLRGVRRVCKKDKRIDKKSVIAILKTSLQLTTNQTTEL
jgi:hypothetical protein